MHKIITKILRYFSILFFRIIVYRKKNTNYVVVLSFHFLGDTVSTFPAVELLRKHFKDNNIHIFCFDTSESIYKIKFPKINYLTYKANEVDLAKNKLNLKFFKIIKDIKKLNPFIIFDLTSSAKTAIISLFSGSKKRIGFGNPYLEGFFTNYNVLNINQHVSLYYLNTVNKYFKTKIKNFNLFDIDYNPEDKILVNPFAGWKAKEWSMSNYIKTIEVLNDKYNVSFFAEKKLLNVEIENELRRKNIQIIKSDSIEHMIEIINNCSLLVSNDTGPILIAGLLGKPTFSLYGPTNSSFHKLPGHEHKNIQKQLICSPDKNRKMCFTLGGRKGCPSVECMKYLNFKDVMDELILFINYLKIKPNKNQC